MNHCVRLLALLFFWALLQVSSLAQLPGRATLGYAMAGFSRLDAGALNAELASQGFPELSQGAFAGGLGMTHVKGHRALGFELYNFMSQRASGDKRLVITNFHYLMLNAGPVFRISDGEWAISPVVGLGGGLNQLRLRRDQELTASSFGGGGPLVQASVQILRYIPMPDGSGNWLSYGFTAGYLSHVSVGWGIDGWASQDEPVEVAPSGFFARFALGMGR
jgi:hypothetical protein